MCQQVCRISESANLVHLGNVEWEIFLQACRMSEYVYGKYVCRCVGCQNL